MPMTRYQLVALRADILASVDPLVVAARDGRNDTEMARLYNLPAAPSWWVWRTAVRVDEVFDGVAVANYYPVPAPDGTAAWTNRGIACQIKFDMLRLLLARETLDPSRARTRNSLEAALTDIPSGNNGNLRQGGWSAVQPLLRREATRAERLFVTGAGTDVDPGRAVFAGEVSTDDIGRALNAPDADSVRAAR